MNGKPEKPLKPGKFELIDWIAVAIISGVFLLPLLEALPPDIRADRRRIETASFLKALSSALLRYEIDHGNYPLNLPVGTDMISRDQSGFEGSKILYKYLSGDFDEDGTRDNGEPAYLDGLSWDTNKDKKKKRSKPVSGDKGFMVVDSFGDPIRYLAEPPNKPPDQKLTINPTFDIWSLGNVRTSKSADPKSAIRFITNWNRNY